MEEGSHQELLASRTQYYQLWKQQFPMMEAFVDQGVTS